MNGFLAIVKAVGAGGLYYVEPVSATDPGFGQGGGPVDPGYGRPGGGHPDQGLPGGGYPSHGLPGGGYPSHGLPWGPGHPSTGPIYGGGRPDQGLPTPPVRPDNPIVLPPEVWPPQLPPEVDNSLPGYGRPDQPIVIPPDPGLGIEQPIVIPPLPTGVALLIALPRAQPKDDTPEGTVPAILVQAGKRPVLVYVTGAPQPK